jgi:hypothetical protein
VLQGRIVFTPSGHGYVFEAPTRFDKLFSGMVAPRPVFMEHTKRGWEPLTDEDTFDGDYGRLLAAVQAKFGKWGSSPTGQALMYSEDSIRIELAGSANERAA